MPSRCCPTNPHGNNGPNDWDNGLCSCCGVKDCGVCCCLKVCVGGPCMFGRAMETANLGGCCCMCATLSCFPCCALMKARTETAGKYQIKEGTFASCLVSWCCGPCTFYQVMHEILVNEKMTWGCCGLEKSPEQQQQGMGADQLNVQVKGGNKGGKPGNNAMHRP